MIPDEGKNQEWEKKTKGGRMKEDREVKSE